MDSQNIFRHFVRAVLHEMFRSKTLYNIAASCILLSVMAFGYFWKESYISNAAISTVQRDASANSNAPLQRLVNIYETHSFQEQLVSLLGLQLPSHLNSTQDKIAYLQSHTALDLSENNVVRLSFRSTNPQTSQKVLSVFVDTLLEKAQPRQKRTVLLDQVAQLQKDETRLLDLLKETQDKITEVKTLSSSAVSGRSQDRLSSIREALQDVEVNISAVDAKIDGIKRRLADEDAVHEAAQRLKYLNVQKAKVQSALEENKAIYASTSTEVVSLQQELDNINIEIISITESQPSVTQESRLTDALYQQLRQQLTLEELERESLLSRQTSLQRIQASETKKADADQTHVVELLSLQKQEGAINTELLQTRSALVKVQKKLSENEKRSAQYVILDVPNTPQSYSGLGFIEFLLLGPALAFGLPFCLASVFVLTDSRIRTSRQLKNIIPVPVLGVIPHYNSPKTLRLFHKALVGLVTWGIFVLIVYFTVGVIGLKG